MGTPEDPGAGFVWNGALELDRLFPNVVAARHQLIDAAKAGDWSTVLRLLDEPGGMAGVNDWRPGGTAWFTPLHHAAWHGASVSVAAELIARGALRTLTDARGRTAHDVRLARDSAERRRKGLAAQSHFALRSFLAPKSSPLGPRRLSTLEAHLGALIDARVDAGVLVRHPPVGILHEIPGQRLWFPVPGMHGGFDIALRQGYLEVSSWNRVIGGSGELHLITEAGTVLADRGFV